MKRFFGILLGINIIIVDALGVFFLYRYLSADRVGSEPVNGNIAAESPVNSGCDLKCQQQIYEAINGIKENKVTVTPSQQPTITNVPSANVSNKKTKSTMYVPIPGSGEVLNTDWTDISGSDFYLSKSDYSGLTAVYFEANFRLMNGNGTANVRIFDKTHSIAPSGGELSTSSQASTFVSGGPVYLWEGNNHYVVQARSSTSDTTVYGSGRLKIISEN